MRRVSIRSRRRRRLKAGTEHSLPPTEFQSAADAVRRLKGRLSWPVDQDGAGFNPQPTPSPAEGKSRHRLRDGLGLVSIRSRRRRRLKAVQHSAWSRGDETRLRRPNCHAILDHHSADLGRGHRPSRFTLAPLLELDGERHEVSLTFHGSAQSSSSASPVGGTLASALASRSSIVGTWGSTSISKAPRMTPLMLLARTLQSARSVVPAWATFVSR